MNNFFSAIEIKAYLKILSSNWFLSIHIIIPCTVIQLSFYMWGKLFEESLGTNVIKIYGLFLEHKDCICLWILP
jgi:hypothetical protein